MESHERICERIWPNSSPTQGAATPGSCRGVSPFFPQEPTPKRRAATSSRQGSQHTPEPASGRGTKPATDPAAGLSDVAGAAAVGEAGAKKRAAKHMSMTQLKEELASVEEACQAWHEAAEAQWNYSTSQARSMPGSKASGRGSPGRGPGRSPGRKGPAGGRGRSSELDSREEVVESRVAAALAEVHSRHGLEELLTSEGRKVRAATDVIRQIQPAVDAALRDAQQVEIGLPELLAGRSHELERHFQGVEALNDEARIRRLRLDEMRQECHQWQSDAKRINDIVEAWPEKMRPVHADIQSSESRSKNLEAHCMDVYNTTKGVQEGRYLGAQGTSIAERLKSADIPKLEQDASRLEDLLADMRQRLSTAVVERSDREETNHMAFQLEQEGLVRSLALRNERLRAKQRETAWLRERAELLEQELAMAKEQRDRELWARLAQPLQHAGGKASSPVRIPQRSHGPPTDVLPPPQARVVRRM